jgi:hypothetical protein
MVNVYEHSKNGVTFSVCSYTFTLFRSVSVETPLINFLCDLLSRDLFIFWQKLSTFIPFLMSSLFICGKSIFFYLLSYMCNFVNIIFSYHVIINFEHNFQVVGCIVLPSQGMVIECAG